jgi:hypothetical protein
VAESVTRAEFISQVCVMFGVDELPGPEVLCITPCACGAEVCEGWTFHHRDAFLVWYMGVLTAQGLVPPDWAAPHSSWFRGAGLKAAQGGRS